MHANYIPYTFNRKKIEDLIFHTKMNVLNQKNRKNQNRGTFKYQLISKANPD